VSKAQNIESDEEFLSLSEERMLLKKSIITNPKDLPAATSSGTSEELH
jgi:hypothetical protein